MKEKWKLAKGQDNPGNEAILIKKKKKKVTSRSASA